MTELEKLKKLTGEKDEELLQILMEDATAWVLAYTNRTRLVSGLDKTIRDLAVIALNRIGTEGEAARTGSGESYTFEDAPKQIYDVLNRKRIMREEHIRHMIPPLLFMPKCGLLAANCNLKCTVPVCRISGIFALREHTGKYRGKPGKCPMRSRAARQLPSTMESASTEIHQITRS